MFRKITLALAAATVVATAAIPTTASAYHWRHHRHHHGVTVGLYAPGPYYAYAPRCYYTRKWVHTHWGWKLKRVRHCY